MPVDLGDSSDLSLLKTYHFKLPTESLTPFPPTLTRIFSSHAKSATVSPLTATLTDTTSCKSFACHSYRKRRGEGYSAYSRHCTSSGIPNAVGTATLGACYLLLTT